MGLSDERVARNDATFRDANEQIFRSTCNYDITRAIPFLCECAEPSCTAIIRLSGDEYARIRADPKRFFYVVGHSEPFQHALDVVERHSTYEVIAKTGKAAEIAEDLDPRPRA